MFGVINENMKEMASKGWRIEKRGPNKTEEFIAYCTKIVPEVQEVLDWNEIVNDEKIEEMTNRMLHSVYFVKGRLLSSSGAYGNKFIKDSNKCLFKSIELNDENSERN